MHTVGDKEDALGGCNWRTDKLAQEMLQAHEHTKHTLLSLGNESVLK
jgi:hypothetical protein